MNLVGLKIEDLIGPSQFDLMSEDNLFNKLVTAVNNELKNELDSGAEHFDQPAAHIEISLLLDNGDFNHNVTDEMIKNLNDIYKRVGWKAVTYEFQEETVDLYASHVFRFYFNAPPSLNITSL